LQLLVLVEQCAADMHAGNVVQASPAALQTRGVAPSHCGSPGVHSCDSPAQCGLGASWHPSAD
jgi:hypothetical protein